MQAHNLGAYPRPPEAPQPGGDAGDAPLEQLVHRAVQEQVDAGIDVPTDGGLTRPDPVAHLLAALPGIEPVDAPRDGEEEGPPRFRSTGALLPGEPVLLPLWRHAQRATSRPLKMTLPGPLALATRLEVIDHALSGPLLAELAEALNRELRLLALAGCRFVQIDEPALGDRPGDALAFGLELLDRTLFRLPPDTTRIVHIGAGDASAGEAERLDQVAEALDSGLVDMVGIAGAHRAPDLAALELFQRVRVLLGVIDGAAPRVEEVEEIRARLERALAHIDRERLQAAQDPGMGGLRVDLARAKLARLAQAAHSL
jgi:5-methyltetrahydropteroyltriglutamate--homocysteine methyltransferase